MRRTILASFVLVLLFQLRAIAAEEKPSPERQRPTAEEICAQLPEATVPELEMKFEVSEEKETIAIRPEQVGQPEVMELRYVASAILGNPDVNVFAPGTEGLGPELLPSQSLWRMKGLLGMGGRSRPSQDFITALTQDVPQEALPPDELLDLLSRGYPFSSVSGGADSIHGQMVDAVRFSVAAPTIEQAKQRAEATAKLLLYGLYYRNQQEIVRELRGRCDRFKELNAQISAAEDSLTKQAEKLKEAEDLDNDALRTLRLQRRLITVDIAGTMARVDACNKILDAAERKSVHPASGPVETLKVQAEIDLVGLMARKQALDQLVAKAEEQGALRRKQTESQEALGMLKTSREELKTILPHYWLLLQANRPKLVEPIKIRPIQWKTEAEPGK